jgi:hypothetical protein
MLPVIPLKILAHDKHLLLVSGLERYLTVDPESTNKRNRHGNIRRESEPLFEFQSHLFQYLSIEK